MTRGTVVLTPFPFTDLHGSKVRPAVVVSAAGRPGTDVIPAFISSVVPAPLLPTDVSLDPSHPDLPATGLKTPSVVKCDKLATVDRRIVLRELGTFSRALQEMMDRRLRLALSL